MYYSVLRRKHLSILQVIMKLKEDELLDDHMRVAFGYHFIIEKVAEYSGISVKGI